MGNKRDRLNDCLERLLRGEDLESCLRDYPEDAEELRPLLQAALGIRRQAKSARLRPEFIARTQARLEMAYQQKYYARKPGAAGIFVSLRRLVPTAALVAILLVVTLSGGYAVSVRASENTIPGEPMYSVKVINEQVKLAFALSTDKKVNYLIRFAETRAEEIAQAAQKEDEAPAEAALERLEGHLARVGNILSREQISEETENDARNALELLEIESIVQDSFSRVKARLGTVEEPAAENEPDEPVLASQPETPALENGAAEPAPESEPGTPGQQKEVGESPPESKSGNPGQEKKEKILDRVEQAYHKTIEDIEKARAGKGKKPGEAGNSPAAGNHSGQR